MKEPQARSLDRNQRILDVALRVFSERGYRDARVDEIADKAKTSKGGVYFHFPSKQAIFLALLDRTKHRLLDKIEEAIATESDPVARADAALVAVLRTFASHKALARLFLVEALGAGREFHERLYQAHEEFAGVVKHHLDDAVAKGVIAPIDTEVASKAWFGALNEVVTQWVLSNRAGRLEEAYTELRPLLFRSLGLAPTRDLVTVDETRVIAGFGPVLERASGAARREGRPVLASLTMRIAPLDSVAVFARAAGGERTFWRQPDGALTLVGAGAAHRLDGSGADRFAEVSGTWQELLAGAVIESDPECPVAAPLCMGGFAFDPDRSPGPEWAAFGDARFWLPSFLFFGDWTVAWLTVCAVVSPTDDPRALARDMESRLHTLLMPMGERRDASFEMAISEGEAPRERWGQAVTSAVAAIRAGHFEKLVLARSVESRMSAPIAPASALARLCARYGGSTVFAFDTGEACFVGATPERLVRVQGKHVMTASVAGSIARGADEDEDRRLGAALLTDIKERHEHALVVRAIHEGLAPLCSELSIPEAPELLRTPALQHLFTPITGTLCDERGVLDLAARLHPTPAVGGAPRADALAWLREHEPFDRGWYAGPVGWMDRNGGGELAVAIRSALLHGDRATLYAGCGIVADSEPEREFEESRLKLRPMLWALQDN